MPCRAALIRRRIGPRMTRSSPKPAPLKPARLERFEKMSSKAPWITYRPELKVLDCTIRDGGLVNSHRFSDDMVRAVYETCLAAGIDYMEIGYKNDPRQFSTKDFGPWKFCDEEDLNRVVGGHDDEATGLKLSAMADAGKSDWKTQIVPRSESVLDMIRVAF